MKLVDIENDIRNMCSDCKKTCEDVIITTYEVVDNNLETVQYFLVYLLLRHISESIGS